MSLGFIRTGHPILQEALELAYATREENLMKVFSSVRRNWGECSIEFGPDSDAGASVYMKRKLIVISSAYNEESPKIHKIAMMIIYELVNSLNKPHHSLNIDRFPQKEYVFLREITEWKGTVLPTVKIAEALVFSHGWPSSAVTLLATEPDLYYLQQQMSGHAEVYADDWNRNRYHPSPGLEKSFPRPMLSPGHTKMISNLVSVRVCASWYFDPAVQARNQELFQRWKEFIWKAEFPLDESLGIETREDFVNLIHNAKYVLSSEENLAKPHERLWQTYEAFMERFTQK